MLHLTLLYAFCMQNSSLNAKCIQRKIYDNKELGLTDWHCHHKNPYHLSRDDRFSNLTVIHESVHRLIHLKDIEKIKALLNSLQLNQRQKEKVNELRKQCKNDPI